MIIFVKVNKFKKNIFFLIYLFILKINKTSIKEFIFNTFVRIISYFIILIQPIFISFTIFYPTLFIIYVFITNSYELLGEIIFYEYLTTSSIAILIYFCKNNNDLINLILLILIYSIFVQPRQWRFMDFLSLFMIPFLS
jgi:hypothetical protein